MFLDLVNSSKKPALFWKEEIWLNDSLKTKTKCDKSQELNYWHEQKAINIKSDCLIPRVIYQGVFTIKLLEKREFKFVFLCTLLSQLFIRKQNVLKLQPFLYNLFQKILSESKPYMANIVCKHYFSTWNKKMLLKFLIRFVRPKDQKTCTRHLQITV